MKPSQLPAFVMAILSFVWCFGTFDAAAAPGNLDPLFATSQVGGNDVQSLAVQADGRILVGGNLYSVAGVASSPLVRLFPDGTPDLEFNPNASLKPLGYSIKGCAGIQIQNDGKILAFGTTSSGVFRFHPDGTADTSFVTLPVGTFIEAMELLPNGKILIGGTFWIDGIQRGLLRLNSDGTIDQDFNLSFNDSVAALELLDDGRIMAGGGFTDVGGSTQDYLVCLNADGSLDTGYNANAGSSVSHILAQPDGKIIVATGTPTGSKVLSRRLSTGAIDPTFTATLASSAVTWISCLQLQTDGKIFVGGNFETVNGVSRMGLARILSTGALDTSFQNSGTNDFGDGSITVQQDGKVLVGGSFATLGGASTPILARLQNDAASSSFVKDATSLRWLRSGASSEIGNVFFELYQDAGNEWLPLGNAARISGGWSVSAASLPPNGVVRARGFARTGNNDFGEVREIFAFGNVTPSLELDGPNGIQLANGAVVDSGGVLDGYSGMKNFLIRNTGTGVLDGLSLTISGTHASQFSVVEHAPGQVAPEGSMPFGIRFAPVGTGMRSAVLTISSNDSGGAFIVNLTGSGTTEFSPFFANATDIPLRTPAFVATGKTFGTLSLGFAPPPGTILTAINLTGGFAPISGVFSDLPDGSLVTASFGGQSYVFLAGYQGGSATSGNANHLTLTLKGAGFPRRDYMPTVSDSVRSIAVGKDHRTMVIEYATGYARLLKDDGTIIPSFVPAFLRTGSSASVTKVIACPDGSFLFGGNFDTVSGSTRKSLARFDANGNFDTTFDANLAGEWVHALAVQRDGKILLSGGNGNLTVLRLNANGTQDAGFSVTVDGIVDLIAQLADGRIVMGGAFEFVNGVAKRDFVRLNADGSLDESFNFTSDVGSGGVGVIAEQSDGKLVIADGAGVSATRLRRVMLDGTMDLTFSPAFDGTGSTFYGLAIQADGKILVGGYFSEVNGGFRKGLVRLNPDGSVDPAFACDCGQVNFLSLLKDGEMIISGGIVAGARHTGLARLMNDPAEMSLQVPDASTVRLMISGAAPETRGAIFDVLQSGSSNWVQLTNPARIAGGWSLAGQSLPSAGIIRWRAIPTGNTPSSVVVEGFKNFGTAAPAISAKGPAGEVLPNGGGIDFGPTITGSNRVLKMRITNHGDGAWDDFSTVISGTNAASFTVISVPERAVLPGETGTFEIRFSPSVAGFQTGLLSISSNDPANSPFQVTLTGTAGNVFSPVFHDQDEVVLTADAFTATGNLFGTLGLTFAPAPGTRLMAVSNTGTGAIAGRFADLADGAVVSASFGGSTYDFIAGYAGGDGNDLVLTRVGPGALDLSFPPTGPSGGVTVSIPLEDGGVLIGGGFSTINGVTRNSLARINSDGSLDSSFNPNANGTVYGIHRFSDGSMLVAGDFTIIGGEAISRVARLNPDGSPDTLFLVSPDAAVRAMLIQPDGKILIGGDFLKVNGVTRNRVARLNADGSLDTGFNPNASASVRCFALQGDGKILVGGLFSSIGGLTRSCVARLEVNGTVDTSFSCSIIYSAGTKAVNSIVVQPDGNLVIGGAFNQLNAVTSLNGVAVGHIARLTPSGATDPSFVASATGGTVSIINPQVDGKLLVGGWFTAMKGVTRNRFARLNSDGSPDSLNPDFGGISVSSISLQTDGKILAGGSFSTVNGVGRPSLVRLLNDPVTSSLERTGSTAVRWLRDGSLSRESHVSFEIHESGEVGWRTLGEAEPIAGGWELAGLSVPISAIIRARATINISVGSYPQTLWFPAFGVAEPRLAVRDRSGNPFQSLLSLADFGAIPSSLASDMEFQLQNTGLADLEAIAVSLTGPAAADYSVILSPVASLVPTASSKLIIRFTPSAAGSRVAELRIASNAPGMNPFVIPLTGSGGSVFSPVFRNVTDAPLTAATLDFSGMNFGSLVLGFAPSPGVSLIAANNTGTSSIKGLLAGLPDQGRISASFDGQVYEFVTTYHGGDGNDLVFVLLGPDAVDPDFDHQLGLSVYSLALQPDGKVIVSGDFTSFGGVPKTRIARINHDGSLDTSFNSSLSARALGMAVQRDGKVIVGSSLTGSDGTIRAALGRLNMDGSLDAPFAPQITGNVNAMIQLRNGGILIGGDFTKVGTTTKTGIALLNTDGSLNTSFTASVGGASRLAVTALAEQADGMILIGGTFLTANSTSRSYLARLNSNGTLDSGFNAMLTGPTTGDTGVACLAVQSDGRILVGGYISGVAGVPRNRIFRLNANGSLDAGFLAGTDRTPATILVQTDGTLIIGGSFSKVNGVSRSGLAKLNADGSLDVSFNPNPQPGSRTVYSMVMQRDGTLLVSGSFSSMNGIGSGKLTRLSPGSGISELVANAGGEVLWNRSGARAELQDVSFELTEDQGLSWTALGLATRTASGWALTGLTLPSNGILRAKGYEVLSNRSSALASETVVFGRSATAIERWREQYFGSLLDNGWAADLADADGDGLQNLMEFALGLDPGKDSSGLLPAWIQSEGSHVVEFQKPPGVDGVNYAAEWSETMGEGSWQLAEDLSMGGMIRFRVSSSGQPNLFLRLKVDTP